MQKFYLLLVIGLFATVSTSLFSQSLPLQMHFSADGHQLITGGEPAEGLFAQGDIHEVGLWFEESNYWNLLTSNYISKTDLGALMTFDGDTLAAKVGVRFKGQTSYSQVNSPKKSFNISLNFEDPDQDIDGYKTINMNNSFQDPSFLHEVLFYEITRKHIPAASATFMHLTINGQDWGIYPTLQQLDGDFWKEWFMNNNGTSWRAEKTTSGGGPGGGGPGGGGPFNTGKSSLNYLGTDQTLYEAAYTLKNTSQAAPWAPLMQLTDVLNNTPIAELEAALTDIMDIDLTTWVLAHEIAFSDDDSYVHKGGMDYYLYWDDHTGLMNLQEYDGNSAMEESLVTWSPFYNETDARFPLLNRMLAVPAIRQRYLAHLRTILDESLNESYFDARTTALKSHIDTWVQSDPKKIYTYSQFNSGVEGVANYGADRHEFLMGNAEVAAEAPSVQALAHTFNGLIFGTPDAWATVPVTVALSGNVPAAGVNLYYGTGYAGKFTRLAMFDDGMHNDGSVGDGVYGISIPGFANATRVRYYVEAVGSDVAKSVSYFPAGAAHQVMTYQVANTATVVTTVTINEFMASNTMTASDEAGEFEDWVELFNKGNEAVDLTGWHLTDKPDNLDKWTFPDGTVLQPQQFMIVWLDEDSSQGPLHANFKLSVAGEELHLVDPDLSVAESVVFGAQVQDMGYARSPNGTGNFIIKSPTFFANNDTGLNAVTEVEKVQVFVGPNPTNTLLNITKKNMDKLPVFLYRLDGRQVYEGYVRQQLEINTTGLVNGLYVLLVGNQSFKIVVQH